MLPFVLVVAALHQTAVLQVISQARSTKHATEAIVVPVLLL
jgi:hypothetical protein